MKITIRTLAIAVTVSLMATPFAFAGQKGHSMGSEMGKEMKMEHSKGMEMEHGKGMEMDHSKMMGDMIHESMSGGHKLAYHLIDNKKQMEKMKDMKGMKMGEGAEKMKSHHLMVYPITMEGKSVSGAKVGYLVKGPEGGDQKAMAMEMQGGYGADINMMDKGTYTIKVKIVDGDNKIVDEFNHEVK